MSAAGKGIPLCAAGGRCWTPQLGHGEAKRDRLQNSFPVLGDRFRLEEQKSAAVTATAARDPGADNPELH